MFKSCKTLPDAAKTPARKIFFRILAAACAATAGAAAEEPPSVAASIAPLHSLLHGVSGGEAHLLVPPDISLHGAQLPPSRAKILYDSAAVFYLDESFELFLRPALAALPPKVRRIRLSEGLALLPYAEEHGHHEDEEHGEHEEHDKHGHDEHGHEDEEHEGHDEHGHDEHKHENEEHEGRDEHGHDEHKHENEEHDGHDEHGHDEHKHENEEHEGRDEHGHEEHGHAHSELDMHVWLDPARAREIVRRMAREMAEINPPRRAEYEANARRLDKRLADLDKRLAQTLAPARNRPYAVMHDAYRYFSRRYGLAEAVPVSDGAERTSARRLAETRRLVREKNIRCLFAEPYLPAQKTDFFAESSGGKITVAVADPLGTGLNPGEDLYFELLENLADSFAGCLSAP